MHKCEKCEELDEKIEHYRNLMAWVSDRQTNEGIGELIIEGMQAQKAALHRNLTSCCPPRPYFGACSAIDEIHRLM
jgi:hypothetical protein